MEAVIVALVSGGITLVGVLIANSKTQAVMDTKLEELTREVREHNNFAKANACGGGTNQGHQSSVSDLEEFHKPD